MIELTREALLAIGTAVGSALLAAAKWLASRASQFAKRLNDHEVSLVKVEMRLDDHEGRLVKIELEYVTKEALRLAVVDIKDIIENWGTDIKGGVEKAHGRLDIIYNELLRRAGS